MKKKLITFFFAVVATIASLAQNVEQTFYIDFGESNNSSRGMMTEGADKNGHYWNNIRSTGGIYIYPGTTFNLINSDNQSSNLKLFVNVRFTTNGKSGGGGLLSPSDDLLGDLAVATATEDYIFLESWQHHNFITYKGLDPKKAYRFYYFGSRNTTEERAGYIEYRGENVWEGYQQIAGTGIGANGYNGNNNKVLVSDPVFPDGNGEIRMTLKKFRPDRMLMCNAMKVEELGGLERPHAEYKFKQRMYLDVGENEEGRGHQTLGADKNGNYWNNLYSDPNGSDHIIPVGRTTNMVNAQNEATGYKAEMVTVMYTNGYNQGDTNTEPTDENLGDLAIKTATEDYVWLGVDGQRQIKFKQLNKQNTYKFYIYGCVNHSDNRHAQFTLNGQNEWNGVLTLSGSDIGGKGVNVNVRNVAVSDYIFPDKNGDILFTLQRYNCNYAHFSLIKIEEYEGAVRPDEPITYNKVYITGTASENGKDVVFNELKPNGMGNGIYETYLKLQEGTYQLKGITDNGETLDIGEATQSTQEQVVRIRFDSKKQELTVVPVELYVKGNICYSNTKVEYQGDGIWKSEVKMDYGHVFLFSDKYFYFVFNNNDQLAVKRLTDNRTKVAMPGEGFAAENIRLNRGTYTVTLDMRNYEYNLDAPIDEYKISMFGSSVANGTGATDNHGYAYLYGQQLENRYSKGISDNPFYISGISIGGNTTNDLNNRYDEMIHDFGRYVIFGLSLGNEGIHGAANPQAIYNQWRDNMLALVAKARNDGKIPVVMNNYTRGDFTESDYSYVKQLNVLIHQWDVPSFNTLGAIDDGHGHWATNYQNGTDVYHPNTVGHREFMYAMTPSFFDALAKGKELPVRDQTQTTTLKNGDVIAFEPEATLHPFTISVRVKGSDIGRLFKLDIRSGRQTAYVGVNEEGAVYYKAPNATDSIINTKKINDDAWHTITLTHYYAQRRVLLYVDQTELEAPAATVLLTGVKVGDEDSAVEREVSEIFFWRAALSPEEIRALCQGKMLKSSLELYVPADGQLENKAQSLNEVTFKEGTVGIHHIAGQAGTQQVCYTVDGKKIHGSEASRRGIIITDGRKIIHQ